ncbi:hypothetical protein [Brucella cytisi]|uniref:Uncharacterized protein n=1 Tax=Brucella cytisi TaxID=407152 RepID=A0A1J6HZ74_9HYPH|nr:hypothetical protein [Brucella cytisi]OIS90814.1 hypothetical protein BLA27_24730 [Brucella cytisi]
MSSIMRQTYFGPEDFPLLRAFLHRSAYSFDGGDNRQTRIETAKQLSQIFRDGRYEPGQMLDLLVAIRAERLCWAIHRDLDRWENEGGSSGV